MAEPEASDMVHLRHQAFELHIHHGTETLREVVKTYLGRKTKTLKEHLASVKSKVTNDYEMGYVYQSQYRQMYPEKDDPNIFDFDVCLLTSILLFFGEFEITLNEKKHIRGLRDERNELCHSTVESQTTKSNFAKSKEHILSLARFCGSSFRKELAENIKALEEKKFMKVGWIYEVLKMKHECIAVDLKESYQDNRLEKQLKLNLLRWSKQFATETNISKLVNALCQKKVLSGEDKQTIEEEYIQENQSYRFIEIIIETNEKDFLSFLACLREHHSILADLIEDDTSSGNITEQHLKDLEKKAVKNALSDLFIIDPLSEIDSEEIHMAVETELGRDVQYVKLEQCLKEKYELDSASTKGFKITGITWKASPSAAPRVHNQLKNEKEPTITFEKGITELSVPEFAEFIEKRFLQVQTVISVQLKDAVLAEQITPKYLAVMTAYEVKQIFKKHTNEQFGLGIEHEFEDIQTEIRKEVRQLAASTSPALQTLRKFECASDKIVYCQGCVMMRYGNLVVPVDEFKTLPKEQQIKDRAVALITRETVRIIAACMNSLQNGTIHFGIKRQKNRTGFIKGFDGKKSILSAIAIDHEIVQGINQCFSQSQVNSVLKSVRPSCFIPIKDSDAFVIEVDIVPLSGNTIGTPFLVHFPPKGKQEKKYFVYDRESNITGLDENNQNIQILYKERLKERRLIERTTDDTKLRKENTTQRETLESIISRGSTNLIDDFHLLVCIGNRKTIDIPSNREHPFLEQTFKSAKAVFDFDSSPILRSEIETNTQLYKKIVLEGNVTPPIPDVNQIPIWVYCNGDTEQKIQPLDNNTWHRDLFKVTVDFVSDVKKKIPKKRSMIIFLIFTVDKPLERFVSHCIDNEFKNDRCVLITGNDCSIDLKDIFPGYMTEVDVAKVMHRGLDWLAISEVLESFFNKLQYYKLPCSKGGFVSMKPKEKDELDQIEVVSGEEIEFLSQGMDHLQLKERSKTEQTNFYRGNEVSWWNFYFSNHVCKRKCYRQWVRDARRILEEETTDDVQVMSVRYEAGAGGTTGAKYILWKLSQFSKNEDGRTYRCCIPKLLNGNTINQIRDFIFFKDKKPSPIVILVDTVSDTDLRNLKNELKCLAHQKSQKGKLFCLLIVVEAVANIDSETETFLKQRLDKEEMLFFDQKFKDLQGDPEFDIDSLIAFNLLRQDFDTKGSYLKTLVQRHVSQITNNELKVLTILSVINTFDKYGSVPRSIFDDFCNPTPAWSLHSFYGKTPLGHTSFVNTNNSDIWDLEQQTEAFKLLVVPIHTFKGIASLRILSQMLADALLKEIMTTKKMELHTVVDSVLDVMQLHTNKHDYPSEAFVKGICSLFKTRQVEGESGDIKTKFSNMIMRLKEKCKSTEEDYVIKLMQKCTDITKDEMVGQQLARYYIYTKDFDRAEETIKHCLKRKPKNPYLLDTYGQIFKCKLQALLHRTDPLQDKKQRITVVMVAFKAIDKFIESQKSQTSLRVSRDDAEKFGITISYEMEVFTALHLLQNYKKYLADTFLENFQAYLNDGQVQDSGPFDDIEDECNLKRLKSGSETHTHLNNSLRFLEEREYQLKVKFESISHETGEQLLLTFREKFERFFGSTEDNQRYIFNYGVGLKSLMDAKRNEKSKLALNKTYRLIDEDLGRRYKQGDLHEGNRRDFLIYLGINIIRVSKVNNNKQMSADQYRKLLRFSKRLVDIEENASRPYAEAYLFYAMLNWPTENRLMPDIELGTPSEYDRILKRWKTSFENNFRNERTIPKVDFALGKGSIGTDIVNMEDVQFKLNIQKGNTERRAREVYNIWSNPCVIKRLQRHQGTMDETGRIINHEMEITTYNGHLLKYYIKIRSFYTEEALSNRPVTFVLAFSWSGLRAMDVKDKSLEVTRDCSNINDGPVKLAPKSLSLTDSVTTSLNRRSKSTPDEAANAIGDKPNTNDQESTYAGVTRHTHELPSSSSSKESTFTNVKRSEGEIKHGYDQHEPKLSDISGMTVLTRKKTKKNVRSAKSASQSMPSALSICINSNTSKRELQQERPAKFVSQSISSADQIDEHSNTSKAEVHRDSPEKSVPKSAASNYSIITKVDESKGEIQQESFKSRCEIPLTQLGASKYRAVTRDRFVAGKASGDKPGTNARENPYTGIRRNEHGYNRNQPNSGDTTGITDWFDQTNRETNVKDIPTESVPTSISSTDATGMHANQSKVEIQHDTPDDSVPTSTSLTYASITHPAKRQVDIQQGYGQHKPKSSDTSGMTDLTRKKTKVKERRVERVSLSTSSADAIDIASNTSKGELQQERPAECKTLSTSSADAIDKDSNTSKGELQQDRLTECEPPLSADLIDIIPNTCKVENQQVTPDKSTLSTDAIAIRANTGKVKIQQDLSDKSVQQSISSTDSIVTHANKGKAEFQHDSPEKSIPKSATPNAPIITNEDKSVGKNKHGHGQLKPPSRDTTTVRTRRKRNRKNRQAKSVPQFTSSSDSIDINSKTTNVQIQQERQAECEPLLSTFSADRNVKSCNTSKGEIQQVIPDESTSSIDAIVTHANTGEVKIQQDLSDESVQQSIPSTQSIVTHANKSKEESQHDSPDKSIPKSAASNAPIITNVDESVGKIKQCHGQLKPPPRDTSTVPTRRKRNRKNRLAKSVPQFTSSSDSIDIISKTTNVEIQHERPAECEPLLSTSSADLNDKSFNTSKGEIQHDRPAECEPQSILLSDPFDITLITREGEIQTVIPDKSTLLTDAIVTHTNTGEVKIQQDLSDESVQQSIPSTESIVTHANKSKEESQHDIPDKSVPTPTSNDCIITNVDESIEATQQGQLKPQSRDTIAVSKRKKRHRKNTSKVSDGCLKAKAYEGTCVGFTKQTSAKSVPRSSADRIDKSKETIQKAKPEKSVSNTISSTDDIGTHSINDQLEIEQDISDHSVPKSASNDSIISSLDENIVEQKDIPDQSVEKSTSSTDSICTNANTRIEELQLDNPIRLAPDARSLFHTPILNTKMNKGEIQEGTATMKKGNPIEQPFDAHLQGRTSEVKPSMMYSERLTTTGKPKVIIDSPKTKVIKVTHQTVTMKRGNPNERPFDAHSQGRTCTSVVKPVMTYAERLTTTDTLHTTKPRQNEESKKGTYERMLPPRPSRAAKSSEKKTGNRKR